MAASSSSMGIAGGGGSALAAGAGSGWRAPAAGRTIEGCGDGVEVRLGAHRLEFMGIVAVGPAEHAQADLALAHDDLVGTQIAQVVDLLVRMGAGDDQQMRVELARLLDRLAGLERVGDGDDERAGGLDIGEGERVRGGGIAHHDLDAGVVGGGEALLGVLDQDERRALPLEAIGDDGADAAVADEDGVAGERCRGSIIVDFGLGRRGRFVHGGLDALGHHDLLRCDGFALRVAAAGARRRT